MIKKTIPYFLILIQTFATEKNSATQQQLNYSRLLQNDQFFKKGVDLKKEELLDSNVEYKCGPKCDIEDFPYEEHNGHDRERFLDLGTNVSVEKDQMEAPAAKFELIDLIGSEEDAEEEEDESELDADTSDYDDNDDSSNDKNDVDLNFFDDDEEEEIGQNKLKDESEGALKQYNRHGFRMHNFVFPLLLAYKLKFFTIIPLLLGSLVLLVGTTGVAGFFFALFAAALGIHVKYHHHHH